MKSKRGWLLCSLIILMLLLSAIPVYAGIEPPPNSFYGTLTIGGSPAQAGAIVKAKIGGVERGSITTTVAGQYGSSSSPELDLIVSGTTDDHGATISFEVNGNVANETYAFSASGPDPIQRDLTVTDSTPPSVTITPLTPDPTKYNTPTFTGTATDTLTNISSVEYKVDSGNWTAATASDGAFNSLSEGYTFTTAELSDGAHTVYVRATDAATNTTAEANYASDSFTVQTVAPAVTINAVTTPINVATQTLTGTMEAGATVVLTANTAATFGAVTYPTTTNWSCNVTLVEGANTITATVATGTATVTIVLDTTPPTVVSKSPAAGATDATVDTVVTATFSEPMRASTITTSSFTLSASAVSGMVTYNSATYTPTFTPSANLAGNTTYTATLSTAITDAAGNPLASAYSWSFTTIAGDLGHEIADTPPGVPVTLGSGTYTGNVTINRPLTITGTTGTIIHGGIRINPLTGSNVTIENLTITDYTDYGIWIEEVKANDVFIIRKNVIQGVAGSLIGIKVDKVVTGGTGSLTIEKNAIKGNATAGIKLLADVKAATIQFNDITNNTTAGLELATGGSADAGRNWWGDISGPKEQNWNPGGTGNTVVGSVAYEPWLTRRFQTALDDNIAYFGFAMVHLSTGWNVFSTPIALDPACDTWGEYIDLGDGLNIYATSPAYRFNAQTQLYVALTDDYVLKPCDAIYVRMASADTASILYSPNVSVPSKQLYAGWNLIGLAYLGMQQGEVGGLKASQALVSVEQVGGGLAGYKVVVCPPINQPGWIYTGGAIADWNGDGNAPNGWMLRTYGYWVFMLNDGTLAGFTFTPMPLGR